MHLHCCLGNDQLQGDVTVAQATGYQRADFPFARCPPNSARRFWCFSSRLVSGRVRQVVLAASLTVEDVVNPDRLPFAPNAGNASRGRSALARSR